MSIFRRCPTLPKCSSTGECASCSSCIMYVTKDIRNMGKIKVSQHPRPNLITYSRYSKHRILNLYTKAQVNHRMRTVRLAFYCHFRHLIISSSYLLYFQISNIHHHPTTTRIFTLGMISTVLTSQSINQTHVVIINSLKSMFSPEV